MQSAVFSLSLTNPVELVYNGYTIEPNGELVYDPDRLSGWDVFVRGWNTFWRSSLGKGLSIGLFVAATLLLLIIPGTRSVGLYIGAVAGAGATLCMGGAISGWSRKKNSGEFWEGFACYINENWSQTVAISMATALVTFGISQAVSPVRAASASKPLANAVQTLDLQDIRFSQTSVNDIQSIVNSMKVNGWKGDPIDVVRMSDGGLTTVDNSRLLAAKITNTPVKAIVHNMDDAIYGIRAEQLISKTGSIPTTWGEAILNRIGRQSKLYRSLYPYGSLITEWNGL